MNLITNILKLIVGLLINSGGLVLEDLWRGRQSC